MEKQTMKTNNVENTENKPSLILKSVWMALTIFSIMSLLLVGCSAPPVKDVQVTQPAENEPVTTKVMETTEVKMDVKDQKTEVQNTQDGIEKIIVDGTYADVMEYTAPSGTEKLDVEVTVKDDIVTEVKMTAISPNQKSVKFQNGFIAELPNLVIGKKIDEIVFPHTVGGSSLTSAAFNEHLKTLVTEHPVN